MKRLLRQDELVFLLRQHVAKDKIDKLLGVQTFFFSSNYILFRCFFLNTKSFFYLFLFADCNFWYDGL